MQNFENEIIQKVKAHIDEVQLEVKDVYKDYLLEKATFLKYSTPPALQNRLVVLDVGPNSTSDGSMRSTQLRKNR